MDGDQDNNNTDGFINELTEMNAFECEAFELEMKPVHTALVKVLGYFKKYTPELMPLSDMKAMCKHAAYYIWFTHQITLIAS